MSYLVKSGTYTPTLTNVTNISASTAYACNYMIVGRTATVSGKVDIDQTVPGAIELGISLPWPSDFTTEQQCVGVGIGNASGDETMYIKADTTNNRASLNATDTDISNHAHYFTFTYIIL